MWAPWLTAPSALPSGHLGGFGSGAFHERPSRVGLSPGCPSAVPRTGPSGGASGQERVGNPQNRRAFSLPRPTGGALGGLSAACRRLCSLCRCLRPLVASSVWLPVWRGSLKGPLEMEGVLSDRAVGGRPRGPRLAVGGARKGTWVCLRPALGLSSVGAVLGTHLMPGAPPVMATPDIPCGSRSAPQHTPLL